MHLSCTHTHVHACTRMPTHTHKNVQAARARMMPNMPSNPFQLFIKQQLDCNQKLCWARLPCQRLLFDPGPIQLEAANYERASLSAVIIIVIVYNQKYVTELVQFSLVSKGLRMHLKLWCSQWQVWEGPVIILLLYLPTFSTVIKFNHFVQWSPYTALPVLTEALQVCPTHEKSLKQKDYFLLMIWSHVKIMDYRHIISASCVLVYVKQEDNTEHLQTLDRTARDRSKCCCFQAAWKLWAAFLRMAEALEQFGSGVLTNRPKLWLFLLWLSTDLIDTQAPGM